MFFLVSCGLLVYTLQLVNSILKKTEKVRKFIKRSTRWPSTKGVIKSIGIHVDYPWPSATFQGTPIPDLDEKRQIASAAEIVSGVSIEYAYTVHDSTHESSTIQIVPISSMLDIANKAKIGDEIPVFYNPKNPHESYLIATTDDEIREYTWILLQDVRAPASITMVCIALTFVLLLTI